MSKQSKQVSIRGISYEKVKKYCVEHNVPIAVFMDKLCVDFFAVPKIKEYNGRAVDFRTALF